MPSSSHERDQTGNKTARADGLTVVVPAFNEERGIRGVIGELRAVAANVSYPFEIIIVDDGSTDKTAAEIELAKREPGAPVRVIRNDKNSGYGFSLKKGIREASNQTVVITDGDGTYPNEKIPELMQKIQGGAAMSVGARSLLSSSVPMTRKPAKLVLNKLANFLAGRSIPDYNSGLRAMRRDLVEQFEPILPDGFSFTTTITLAALTNGYHVEFVPIEYAKRTGESKIRPIRDTVNFFNLIVRTVLYFRPMKVFVPLAILLYFFAFTSAVRDIIQNRYHYDILTLESQPVTVGAPKLIGESTLILFLTGLHMLVVGFLADLACESFRPMSARKASTSRAQLYEKPLQFLMIASAFMFAIAIYLWIADKYIHVRLIQPKTLGVFITALQFFSAALLADLLQRRGRLK
ncbi:MAG: glycosyltransferase family 2 protein [Planctomycetota bacterium]